MVATGSPEATDAAVRILEMGGNAIDAAVAAALTLGIADPDASGLGGMTLMVIHLAIDQTVVIDGTSPTPLKVNPTRLRRIKEAGTPGSDLIPSIIVNVVSNLVDRKMRLGDAVTAPRILFGGVEALAPYIEVTSPITDSDLNVLEAAGHIPVERLHYPQVTACAVYFGGVNAVGWDAEAKTYVGVGDGRRWGSAKGARVVAEAVVSP